MKRIYKDKFRVSKMMPGKGFFTGHPSLFIKGTLPHSEGKNNSRTGQNRGILSGSGVSLCASLLMCFKEFFDADIKDDGVFAVVQENWRWAIDRFRRRAECAICPKMIIEEKVRNA